MFLFSIPKEDAEVHLLNLERWFLFYLCTTQEGEAPLDERQQMLITYEALADALRATQKGGVACIA